MSIRKYQEFAPILGAGVYIDTAALVIGQVMIGDDASIWPFAVVRGDVNRIRIGARSNVQDGSVLHVVHAGPFCPAGLSLSIGADSVVPPGKRLESGGLYLGSPARRVRDLTAREMEQVLYIAAHYVRLKNDY